MSPELAKTLKTLGLLGLGAGAVGAGIPLAGRAISGIWNTATGGPGQVAIQGVGTYQMYRQRQNLSSMRDDTKYIPELAASARSQNQSLDSIRNDLAAVAVANKAALPPQNITVPRQFGIPATGRVDGAVAEAYRAAMMTGVGKRGKDGNPYIWGRE